MSKVTRPFLATLPKLPHPELWSTLFKGSRARGQLRVSVMTEEAADMATKEMNIANNRDKTIVELFPGPGQWTRSMALGGAKKILAVENGDTYMDSLKVGILELEQASQDTIKVLPLNPADPYDEILDPSKNMLPGVEPQPWDHVHTGLTLVGSIPNSTFGERVLHELLLASIDRMGIFTLGRVEMYMFCYKDAVNRLVAAPGTPSRNRITLMAEAAADITPLMRPGLAHFHLPYDYQLLRLVPHEKPKIETSMEVMDFCLRSLFTNKSHSLNKVIKLLGPGADILLGRLSFDHNIKVKHLTLEQLNEVALKFEQWPLRPTVLYDDMIMHESKRRK
ncbi:Dimethyladenosine transferase 2, mitochondrial [Podila minutissima]|uniref:rRNA adenine N(6)-methyltransferase n=1 Tax=Podila minutissima TaxID=64525 RepID=A0A9P5SHB8_9FUNG|nr:Dimethyladenosine transferase 2, mitochondrial [Podila minutissima]